MVQRKWPGTMAVIGLSGILAACAPQSGPGGMPSTDRLVRQFEAMAFPNGAGRIYKRDRLVVWLEGHKPERFRPIVEEVMMDFSEQTGMRFEFVATQKDATQTIEFRPGTFFVVEDGRSLRAVAKIAERRIVVATSADPGEGRSPETIVRHSLDHELLHSMGFFGHTPKGIPSVLYYSVQPEIQTMIGIDRLLLKVLYDPRLRLGMSPAAARPHVRIVIDELHAGAHFTQTENQPVIPGGAPPIIAGSTPSGLIRGVTIRTNGRPALAAADGIVAIRVESDGLWEVKIDHPASFMGTRYLVRSVYQGLSDLTVDIGQKVRRGDEIGRSELLTFGAVLHQGVGFDQHVRLPVFWRTRAGRVECYNPAKRYSSDFPNESVYSGNTVSFTYPASCGAD